MAEAVLKRPACWILQKMRHTCLFASKRARRGFEGKITMRGSGHTSCRRTKSPGEARCGREDRLTPSEDEHRKEHKVVVQCGNEALVDDASAHYRQVLSHPHHDDHTDLKPAP